ncbi:YbaB/EbfC family nucleoid-associated protein [Criblamydia sequanensis]|uniref:Nucleoid-associated protein CSEC_0706 n=1 Tax=Candidatus Criblamydia sequanensis CRIB-18 TaxID=1437425 RepID=A0A090D1G4_9BACT|nr:YbaB/EbfC family nucleoid-associated protein [Criblamydia sequanensis]CDR33538.1 Nucleoid-associated protein [Criblamydia sequanensis CRIB-18]
MGTGFAKKKKQAKMMQEQLMQMQDKLKNLTVTGTSPGGLVNVTLDGEGDVLSIKIKKECVDPEDVEGLEDLVKAAFQEAKKTLKKETSSGMPAMPANMFPGMGF